MKRNWDTVRRILLAFEEDEYFDAWTVTEMAAEINEDPFVVEYHMRLLSDSGFLMIHPEITCWTEGLTMKGHDLLDQIREQAL